MTFIDTVLSKLLQQGLLWGEQLNLTDALVIDQGRQQHNKRQV